MRFLILLPELLGEFCFIDKVLLTAFIHSVIRVSSVNWEWEEIVIFSFLMRFFVILFVVLPRVIDSCTESSDIISLNFCLLFRSCKFCWVQIFVFSISSPDSSVIMVSTCHNEERFEFNVFFFGFHVFHPFFCFMADPSTMAGFRSNFNASIVLGILNDFKDIFNVD